MNDGNSAQQSRREDGGSFDPTSNRSRQVAEEIDALIDSLDSLGRTLPGIMGGLGGLWESQREEIQKYEKQHAVSVSTARDSKTVTMTAETITHYRKLIRDQEGVNRVTVLLPEIFLVALVSQYDAFLGGLVRALMRIRPEIAKGSSTSLTFAELAAFDSMDAAREFVIADEIEQLLRKSHAQQFTWLRDKFNISLISDLPEWPGFIELTERRNLFVHTRGVVSSQYLRVCREHGVEHAEERKLGQKLYVDSGYFGHAHRCVLAIGVMLGHTLWRKILPDCRDEADEHLGAVGYDLLVTRRYKAAARLLDFACGMRQFKSEEYRRRIVVNRAQAYKWMDEHQKCTEIMAGEDWSASGDAFQLAEAVLRDDVENAVRVMRRLGDTHEIVVKQSYREWPLFREIRKEELFRTTFEAIFKEPLERVEVDMKREGS